jgi:hypothetical protein
MDVSSSSLAGKGKTNLRASIHDQEDRPDVRNGQFQSAPISFSSSLFPLKALVERHPKRCVTFLIQNLIKISFFSHTITVEI